MLQRFPGQLQRHPLLRVDVVGLHLRQREELGVETLDVGEVSAAGAGLGDPFGDARLVEELRPAALGQVGDAASRPSSSACHVSSGVFMSPGNRVASPTIAMSSTLAVARPVDRRRRRSSTSGSPSTITVASDSMVGWRNATVAVSVTPVRSSMSLAIATASRDDRPSSTIGVESSIASARLAGGVGDPVAQPLAHLRDGHVGAAGGRRTPKPSRSRERRVSSGVGRFAVVRSSVCESGSVSAIVSVVSRFRRGRRWPPSRCAGCRRGRRRGRRGGRSCHWRCAGSRRRASAARRAR